MMDIVFVVAKSTARAPSTYMRALQLSYLVNKLSDLNTRVHNLDDIKNIKNKILIFNKFSIQHTDPKIIKRLSQDNKIVFDYVCLNIPPKPPEYVDMFVASSVRQYNWMNEHGFRCHKVLHHADPRIIPSEQEVRPKVKYFGITSNTIMPDKRLIEIIPVGMNAEDTKWMHKVLEPCIHYNLRSKIPGNNFKPFTKNVLAAHTNSLVITDEADDNLFYMNDYPYMYRGGDINNFVAKTIKSVVDKDDDFVKAKEIMKSIKEEFSHQSIVNQFVEMIKLLEPTG